MAGEIFHNAKNGVIMRLKLVNDHDYVHYMKIPKEYFINNKEIKINGLYNGTVSDMTQTEN